MTDPTAAVTVQNGFPEDQRAQAAALYWAAFSGKLGRLMGPEARGIAFIHRVLNPDFAICVCDDTGTLIGLAGFKTKTGALVGGDLRDLVAVYGWFGTVWRAPLLSVLERDVQRGVLLMDGIMVVDTARGQGVGTRLLDAIKARAAALGCTEVRLDVIDTNPRARALYERQGFSATDTMQLGPLRLLFGFRRATTMLFSMSKDG